MYDVAPLGVMVILPLFCPHVACVGAAVVVTAVELLRAVVTMVEQLLSPVTVTVYEALGAKLLAVAVVEPPADHA